MAGTSSPTDLFRGFAYPMRGVAFIRRQRDLSRYWLPPIIIMCAALGFSLWLAGRYHDDLLAWLWPEPTGSDWIARLLSFLHSALEAVTFLVIAVLLAAVCAMLSTVIAAPFNDALSEVIEQREAGIPIPPFQWSRLWKDSGRTVRLELLKLLCYSVVMGPLLLFSWLVPGVGHVVYVLFGGLFTALYFALDYIDWPASRRGQGVGQRLTFLRRRPWLMLGFGLAVWLLMLIPFLNLWLMPAAVAGGTRLFLDVERESVTTRA
jgi:CysZ protein